MDKASFAAAFDHAATRTRVFAEKCVAEQLPLSLLFDLQGGIPSGPPQESIARVGGPILASVHFQGATAAEVVDALWSDGLVPAWVNLSVHAADADYTRIEVSVSRQLVDPALFLSPLWGADAPFEVRGPALPPGWVSPEESGRFGLGRLNVWAGRVYPRIAPDERGTTPLA